MARTEKQKMQAGELYHSAEAGLQADQAVTHAWLVRYNASLGMSGIERRRLLAERLPTSEKVVLSGLPFIAITVLTFV